ncbi:unnamed protein product (macronuclear) [Paramecium tetraurelia]|uniref:THH1/TOM1/TOM3 domain-containing protein n=1 Tax=Paramecium tetraurelia TaxID=5888 RepID=A0DY26_PARTE|nr:uncharacterized protein GSPATT00021568001 [Paramecium tetraurelia]CAK87943.1 unnamed protein product [Paramecium tetraurelia]|eukprot:XP_001455340.1 hypothetical protein (macronuclear) [Paramecium tetraurelia strain d4-2]
MKNTNIIDFVDAILSCLLGTLDDDRLDVNILIGMVCRIIFFVVTIIVKDLNTYTWFELIAQMGAWFIFHVYVITCEFPYFSKGLSQTEKREQRYKYMDMFQLIIAISYLLANGESNLEEYTIEFYTLTFFGTNLFINVFGLFLSNCQKNKKPDYQKEGGLKNISCGLCLGSIIVIIYLFIIKSKYEEEIEASTALRIFWLFSIIGEFVVAFASLIFGFLPKRRQFTFAKDGWKGWLGIFYGITFGLFSIFYGFLIGIIIILGFIILVTACKQRSVYEVPPTITS